MIVFESQKVTKSGNIPENADDYMLSLHYEGNALDLIDTINVILGTSMEIENQ